MLRLVCFTMVSVLVAGASFMLAGCGNGTAEVNSKEKPLKLYFVNDEFIETGREEGVLVEYDGCSIYLPEETPKGMTKEEADSNTYTTALTMLWDEPENLDDVESVVTERIGIRSVTVEDGTAYVDLTGEDLKRGGGSMEETLFISQIVETLINSFEEIERVQFLVDGNVEESLMGHCSTSEPFDKGMYSIIKAEDFEKL